MDNVKLTILCTTFVIFTIIISVCINNFYDRDKPITHESSITIIGTKDSCNMITYNNANRYVVTKIGNSPCESIKGN